MVRTTLMICLVPLFCFALQAEEVTTTVKDSSASKPAAISVLKKKAQAKTLARDDGKTTLKRAVHVNANGIDRQSNPRGPLGAVNRLRSVRDSVFLPPPAKRAPTTPAKVQEKGTPKVTDSRTTPKTTAPKPVVPGDSKPDPLAAAGNTSRRQKTPLRTPTVPGGKQVDPPPAKVTTNTASMEPRHEEPAKIDDEPVPARKVLPSVVARRGKPISDPTLAVPPANVVQVPEIARRDPRPNAPTLAEPVLAEPLEDQTNSEPTLAEVPSTLQAAPGKPAPMKLIDITPRNVDRASPGQNPTRTEAPRVAIRPNEVRSHQPSEPMKLEPVPPLNNLNLDDRVRTPSTSPTVKSGSSPDAPPQDGLANDDVLLANRSPVLIIKTHGQPTIRVGRAATFYITADNAGDLTAEDVVVSVNVPSWAELARNQASSGLVRVEPSSNGDNLLRWSIRDLQPGSRQKLRIDMIPRASRPIDLGVTWNFKSVSAMAQIEVQEAKLKMSVVGPADIQYGETKLYTINISNPGTGDAENVVLTLLPITDGTDHAGVRELGDIKAGTRRTVEVELTARQAGDLAVRARATADGGLKTQGEQKVRVRRAHLTVEAVGPTKRYAGTSARYAIKIMNTGDATARDVVTNVTLPLAAKYEKSSGGGVFDSERGKVRWNIGALRPGAFQIIELTTTLMGAGTNRLEVRSSGDGHLSAVEAVQTEVEALADLKLYVDDPTGVVPVATEVTYGVRIVNRGTRAAHNVDVIGYFSEGIEPVSIHGWHGNVEVGQVVLDTIPRIAPGQEIVVKVIAQADRVGDHVFRAEVHAKDPATKLAVDEWTRFDQGDEVRTLDASGLEQARDESDKVRR